MYCPYIAGAMLDAKVETYSDMKGMTIYNLPIVADRLADITVVPLTVRQRTFEGVV